MKQGDVELTVSFILPSLAGLSRALQLSPFLFRANQLLALCHNTQFLIQDETLDNIRTAITTCLKEHDATSYSRRVLNKYWEDGTPLSSNRVVYDLLVILRNVTTRVIADSHPDQSTTTTLSTTGGSKKLHLTRDVEHAWSELMKKTASGVRPTAASDAEKDELLNKNMRTIYVTSLGYYEDIKKYANEGEKWAPDAYMQEIMGTSLVSHYYLCSLLLLFNAGLYSTWLHCLPFIYMKSMMSSLIISPNVFSWLLMVEMLGCMLQLWMQPFFWLSSKLIQVN